MAVYVAWCGFGLGECLWFVCFEFELGGVLLRSRFLLLGFTGGFMGVNSVGFVVLICILPDLFVLWC